MTREEVLAAIALADRSSAGPWLSAWDDPDVPADSTADGESMIVTPDGGMIVGIIYHDGEHVACKQEDAALLAASRTLVPSLAKALLAAMDRAEKAERDVLRLRAHHVESLVFEMVQEPESESLPVISDGWSCGICGGGFDTKEAVEHPDDTCPLYVEKDPE